MEDLTKGVEHSIRRGLAELFALLVQEEGGIAARWYRIDSCKNETLKPGKGSEPFEPFDNPIPPLLQIFRLGKVHTNKVLLSCGILEPHFLPPFIHMEIGLINNVMTRLDDFIEERVESLIEE